MVGFVQSGLFDSWAGGSYWQFSVVGFCVEVSLGKDSSIVCLDSLVFSFSFLFLCNMRSEHFACGQV